MKSILNILSKIILAITLTATFRSFAGETIPLPVKMTPFLKSTRDMEAYFKLLQRRAAVNTSAASGQREGWNEKQWFKAPSDDEIIQFVDSTELSLDILNPKDTVYHNGWTYNKDGRILFEAHDSQQPFKWRGGWDLRQYNLHFKLASQVPLPKYAGIYALQVMTTNSAGQTQSRWFGQDDEGNIWIDPSISRDGLSGTMVFHHENDGPINYDISTGNRIDPIHLRTEGKAWFQNSLSFEDSDVVYRIGTSSRRGENVSSQLTVNEMGVYTIKVETSEGRYPQGYNIYTTRINEETGEEEVIGDFVSYEKGEDGSTGMSFTFDPGLYGIVPVWNPTDLRSNQPGCPPGYTCEDVGIGSKPNPTK